MPIGFHFVSVSRGEFELLELLKGRDDRVWAGLGCVLPLGAFGFGGCNLRRHVVRNCTLSQGARLFLEGKRNGEQRTDARADGDGGWCAP